MNNHEQASKLYKNIEKLRWQLDSGISLSVTKRKAKGDEIKDLKQELVDLEQKLTELRLTKMNMKLHL